jgi:hypothetical protein
MHWISGSIEPFIDYNKTNPKIVSPNNYNSVALVDRFRQGIELSNRKDAFQKTIQPKIWSGHRDRSGSIDNKLKDLGVGMPISVNSTEQTSYNDLRREYKSIDYLQLGNRFPLPIVFNNGPENLYGRGIIEPLTIPERLPTNEAIKSISHTIKAFYDTVSPHKWFGQNRGGITIERYYNPQKTLSSPFIDFIGERFGNGYPSGSVIIGGFFDNTQATIAPYDDSKINIIVSRSYANHLENTDFLNFVKNIDFENKFLTEGKIQAGSGLPFVYGKQAMFAKHDSMAFYDRIGQRSNGHSRIKGKMPHARIQDKQNNSGSFPVNQLASIDRRTATIQQKCFDDTKTLVFNNQTLTSTNFPLVLVETNQVGLQILSSSHEEYNTTLHVPNIKQKKGISDVFLTKNGIAQVGYKIYNDQRNHIPAFLSAQKNVGATFFLTGSHLPGFTQELTGKTIVEIEMPQKNNVSFGFRSGSGDDYPMSYYDFGEKTMYAIGSRKRLDEYTSTPIDYFYEKAIGFGPMHSGFIDAEMNSAGLPIDNFGFPWHSKYNVPTTSSMLYSLTASISEPFLLEKIMLEFSGSVTGLDYPFAGFSTIGLASFFILHQSNGRRAQTTQIKKYSPETSYYNLSSSHTSGSLALVTAVQIGHRHSTDNRLQREFMLPANYTHSWDTNGIVVISGSVKMPTKSEGISDFTVFVTGSSVNIVAKNSNGGRTGIFEPWTRNFREVVSTTQPAGSVTNFGGITFNNEPWKVNPYILLPQDKLIFGWQAPFGGVLTTSGWLSDEGPTLNIAKGNYRLYLIGSYLKDVGREFKEMHKTSGQELSSINVHEVIE